MAAPTLKELSAMADQLRALEHQEQQANHRAAMLRACGGKKHIGEWFFERLNGYHRDDYDGYTKLLADALTEFGPAILETLARRQELAAHQAMTKACLKRAELATFVQLESPTTEGA